MRSSLFLAAFAALVTVPAVARGQTDAERCLAENKDPSPEIAAQREALVPSGFNVFAVGTAGFHMGAGLDGAFGDAELDTSFGYGYTLGARADVSLLDPLWLAGRVRMSSAPGKSVVMVDALGGLNFRTYGNRWVKAGSSTVTTGNTAITSRWSSHCQLRRSDFQLLGGVKLIATTGAGELEDPNDVTAFQVGIQKMFKVRNASQWSLAVLYDPFDTSYGAQFAMGLTGLYGLPSWLWVENSAGFLYGENQKAFWYALDLGVAYEL